MIRVLIVDDHDLVRMGIRRLIDDLEDIEVVGEAASGEEAIKFIRDDEPNVVLMDVSMPGIGGLETTRKLSISHPHLPIVIVTVHTEDPFPNRLLKAGAAGYLHKGCNIEEIEKAIIAVHRGQKYVSPDIAQALALALLQGTEDSPFDALSEREMQVLMMFVRGNKVREISKMLNLSPKTVSTYRYRVFEKLGVKNDAELTRLAMRHGVLEGVE